MEKLYFDKDNKNCWHSIYSWFLAELLIYDFTF